jgi:hypothetical protein
LKQTKKPIIFALIGLFILLSLKSKAQDTTFSIAGTQLTIIEVFEQIEKVSPYHFLYQPKLIQQVSKRSSIKLTNTTIEEATSVIENTFGVACLVDGTNISVKAIEIPPKPELYDFNGKILDKSNLEILIGASLYCDSLKKGTISDINGFFTIPLPAGKHKINIRYTGYKSQTILINIESNLFKIIRLEHEFSKLRAVTIRSHSGFDTIQSFNIRNNILHVNHLSELPSITADQDIIQSIDFIPGVNLNAENLSGYSIRGSSEGENLTIMDNVPVYSLSHNIGNLSIFSSSIINNIIIRKGGVPAKYGGRAASAIQVVTRDGNQNELQVKGALSNLSNRLSVEGPLKKRKVSYLISGRRGGKDFIKKPHQIFDGQTLYFYDLNTKINYQINTKNKLTGSTYWGRDVSDFMIDSTLTNPYNDWSTNIYTLNWNRIINTKLTQNICFFNSNYNYYFEQEEIYLGLNINDFGVRADYNLYSNTKLIHRFGLSSTFHSFLNPKVKAQNIDTSGLDFSFSANMSLESALYYQQERKISEHLEVNLGLRFSMFNQITSGNYFISNVDDSLVDYSDEIYVDGTEEAHHLFDFSPSMILRYKASSNSIITVSYTRASQYMHQLSSINAEGLQYKILVPSSKQIKPLKANQFAFGYLVYTKNQMYEIGIEAYYKQLNNILVYNDFVRTIDYKVPLSYYVSQGKGKNYGLEFHVHKRLGKLKGIMSFTRSEARKHITGINNNNPYYSSLHVPFDFALNLNYQLSNQWSVSTNFVYKSGKRYTEEAPVLSYIRNAKKLPNYHRADLGFKLKSKDYRKLNSTWMFSVYNIYNRKNTFFLYRETNANKRVIYSHYSLFGIVPSISWSFTI